MPIPIKPVNDKTDKNLIDYSWLFSKIPGVTEKDEKKESQPVDKDANLLMEVWTHAEKKSENNYRLNKEVKITSKDITRLKLRGLIEGSSDEIRFTGKGKAIIGTMALGENNNFLKNQKQKTYTEILASMDKRGKKGFRLPKFSAGQIRL